MTRLTDEELDLLLVRANEIDVSYQRTADVMRLAVAEIRALRLTPEEVEALRSTTDIMRELSDRAGLDGRLEERGDIEERIAVLDRIIAAHGGGE